MPKKTVVVTRTKRSETRLPDVFAEGAALVHYLAERRFFDAVMEKLKVDRSGYAGVDAVLLLVYYFAARVRVGFSGFDEIVGHHRQRLGALGGRLGFPTQSAMSRLLGDLDLNVVRAFGGWLLREATEADEVLRHPSVVSVDALGRSWHVFHLDDTKTGVRERALPEGEDLPPAHRRATALAAPGHLGHKRGEIMTSRSTLQHAGSRLWLNASMDPGNGDQRQRLRLACVVMGECGDRLGHPRSRLLCVADGEFGHVPALTEARKSGICMITRLNRPNLLDQDDVRHRMATGIWYFVPDSRSGPRRSAMDIGFVTVRPGATTVQDNGTPYDPIDARVVVSRYPRKGKAEHGRVIDDWQYELFVALDMEPEAWPAPDVITEYFHRGGEENAFAQEDRELQLDRILSYNPTGQELCVLVGLAVWNLRVVLGFRMNPLPAERTPAACRVMEVDPRPFGSGATCEKVEDTQSAPVDPDPQPSAPQDAASADQQPEPPIAPPNPKSPMDALRSTLSDFDCSRFLNKHQDWSFSADEASLRCPAGQALRLCGAYKANSGGARVAFHATTGVCGTCLLRGNCLTSANPDAAKMVFIAVPPDIAAAVSAQVGAVRQERRLRHSERERTGPAASGQPRPPRRVGPLPVVPAEDAVHHGESEISRGQLLPAAVRSAFRAACQALVVHVQLVLPPPQRKHPYLVTSAGQRQHRRATWQERHARYALPSKAQLTIVFEGAAKLDRILQPQEASDRRIAS